MTAIYTGNLVSYLTVQTSYTFPFSSAAELADRPDVKVGIRFGMATLDLIKTVRYFLTYCSIDVNPCAHA